MNLYGLISANANRRDIWISDPKGEHVSYARFFDEVELFVEELSRNFSTGEVVVIDREKTISTVAFLFACVKLELGYCFLDRNSPIERRNAVISLVRPKAIYSDRSYGHLGYQATDLAMMGITSTLERNRKFSGNIIYTSGSTGVPKGVMVSASALAYYVDSMMDAMPTKSGTWLSISPLHFDIFQLDFFVQFARGLNIVVAESGLLPQQIMSIIKERDVSELVVVSTILKMLSVLYPVDTEQSDSITKIYYGGEGCPIAVLNRIASIFPRASFCQFYGPTENTNNSTYYHFEQPRDTETGFMPLGSPLKHVRIVLVSGEGQEIVEPFVEGEITILGDQLMDGYVDLELDEHANFTVHDDGEKVYSTGDYGFVDELGLLWFRGRKDDLVKIRGNRISLQEIEANLMRCMKTSGHVLATTHEIHGFESLVAGVSSFEPIDVQSLRNELFQYLPPYAVPERIVAIDISEVDILSTGKLDRKRFKSKILEETGEQE